MRWQDREQIVWSINNYLGIANLPEVREADVEFARLYGFARPMGSRMMCGETDILEQLEEELANYVKKAGGALSQLWVSRHGLTHRLTHHLLRLDRPGLAMPRVHHRRGPAEEEGRPRPDTYVLAQQH